jgi:hypothetical protein
MRGEHVMIHKEKGKPVGRDHGMYGVGTGFDSVLPPGFPEKAIHIRVGMRPFSAAEGP